MRAVLLSVLSMGVAACTAVAQPPAEVTLAEPARPAPASTPPYLAQALDLTRILPTAPVKGTARFEGDRAVFRETRALVGSPRWDAAIADVKEDLPDIFKTFSCALDVDAAPAQAPRLAALLDRSIADLTAASNTGKAYFKRERPPANDPGATCHALTERDMTRDYPSGHAGRSWLVALILTELAPDRADAILTRGRSFGESRVVCGVHNATAVEAGRVTGASVFAALHGDAAFRADMDAARRELAEVRARGRKPIACEASAALLTPTPY